MSNARPSTITAPDLVRLLARRHTQDVFVHECKNGPSQGVAGMQRLDGWAMKKSWLNPLAIGYEVKVSRSDFTGDRKWPGYLEYCNEFYFVTPLGLIEASEVPEPAGLIVCSRNCKRLFIKKKAPYRDLEVPASLLKYILFARVAVCDSWELKWRLQQLQRLISAEDREAVEAIRMVRRVLRGPAADKPEHTSEESL